jgi:hypothetical protein
MTSGEPIVCENVDTIVLNDALAADTELERSLAEIAAPVVVVGDAVQPRTVEEAVLEGFRAGWEI